MEGRPPWGSSLGGVRQKPAGAASRPSTAPSPRGTVAPSPAVKSPKKSVKKRSARKPAADPGPSAHEVNCEAAKEVAELIGRKATPPQSPQTDTRPPRPSPGPPHGGWPEQEVPSGDRRDSTGGVFAGCRVDSFVDDRVVAIAALDEVSSHADVLRRLVTVGVVWCAGLIRHR